MFLYIVIVYKKLHLIIDNHQIIQGSELTDSYIKDQCVVHTLINPIEEKVKHITANGTYDNNPTYKAITKNFQALILLFLHKKGAVAQKVKSR
jgi:hypothetical protein